MSTSPPFEASARRNVLLYYAFGLTMDFGLWFGIWIKYLIETRHLELKWILAMDLPFWLLVAVLQAPTGALADHIGRKRVLAIGGVLFSLTIFGFGLTQNYWMLFFDYVLWAFAMSMRGGTDSAMVFDSLKLAGREDEYRKVSGRGFALTLAAGLAGVVLGGIIAEKTGMAFVVQVSAIPPLVAAGIALLIHEPPVERQERHYWAGLRGGMSFAWKTPQVRYTLLMGSVLLTGTFGPVVLVQPFLIHRHVETGLFGVYQAPLRLVSIAAALLAFRLARRADTGRIVLIACAAIITAYAGLGLLDTNAAFAFFALPSLVSGLTNPIIGGHLNERIPSERRATVLSTMQLLFALQVGFFEPALGFFADDVSLAAAFFFAGAYFVILMPPLLLLWRRAHGVPVEGVTAPAAAEAAPGA